ncbi:hypothetical protein NA57DRAFT_54086 [Rhizodiscina lignyota]|uniref:Uncharacterized protein n=1 Tax=Rhizodiscina lignyota TaxID=1504668 RepID=A0A9P4MC79_9PEZI|nr:hypothetical protein NA57DRAFT_54086 [Rhizodiscina lignyota]
MSKDLLADLDDFYQPSAAGQQSNNNVQANFLFFDDANSISQPAQQHRLQSSAAAPNYSLQASDVGRSFPSSIPSNVNQDDDDWGDFEDAPASAEIQEMNISAQPSNRVFQEQPVASRSPQQTTVDPFDLILATVPQAHPSSPNIPSSIVTAAPKKAERISRDPNVIFDVDEDQFDDDFGDFEDATPSEPVAPQKPSEPVQQISQNLLDLDFGSPTASAKGETQPPWQTQSQVSSFRVPATPSASHTTQSTEKANTSVNEDPWGEFDDRESTPEVNIRPKQQTSLGSRSNDRKSSHRDIWDDFTSAGDKPKSDSKSSRTTKQKPAPKIAVLTNTTDDDAWDDFESSVPTQPPAPEQVSSSTTQPPSLPNFSPVLSETSPIPTLPPTNIPPPSLLLTLFSPLISTAQSSFFQPLSSLSTTARTSALSHLQTYTFLKAYLALATVAARVIAGRKLRWKRDSRLAQGMRIGVAGGKGMKLAGIDRGELAKEDREVADVIRVWKEQLGKVRSAVVQVNSLAAKAEDPAVSRRQALSAVPELRETMVVKVAKETEGGVPSRRPCALCGLKREERIVGVEEEVGDVFEEWWVENCSMHRWCANFWEEQGDKLRSR